MSLPGTSLRRALPALFALAALVSLACGPESPPDDGKGEGATTPLVARATGTEGGQWRSWGGDPGNSRYAPLDQIHAGNFGELEIAWSWTSTAAGWRDRVVKAKREGKLLRFRVHESVVIADFQTTPLMVDGVLYGSTSIGEAFALDAKTGRPLWVHDPRSYRASSGFLDFHFPKHRGVSFWQSATNPKDRRIFLPTMDAWLLALDARTGKPVPGFGKEGRVDLMKGLRGPEDMRRLGDVFHSSPAAVFEDVVIVGNSIKDRPKTTEGIAGDLRAYDARTGELLWTFHTVPVEGDPATDSWEGDSWRQAGAANVWGPITVDPERGLVYAMTSTPTNDFYGGHRLGDNLYAETLLCLDARTGERVWHFQLVHHGLWDYDPGAAPILMEIDRDGERIPAVVQLTKQSMAFSFHRETGEPVWPIEERAVPASDVPGERAAPTQPFPTKPPPYDRQGTREEDLVDFTPELREEALAVFRQYRTGPMYTPPSLQGTLALPGPNGGANWKGGAADLESGVVFVPSITMATVLSVKESDPEKTDFRFETDRSEVVWLPPGAPPAESLPLFKPPYSRVTALDMGAGEIAWQVPNGDGPRDHPRIAHLDLPPLGAGVRACVLATRSLVVGGEGAELFVDEWGAPVLRAWDKATGEVVGTVRLPAKTRGCPMTYLQDGVQYIAVAVADEGGDPMLVALALP